jgi:hypothetical protein
VGAGSRHLLAIHAVGAGVAVMLTAAWFVLGVRPMLSAKQRSALLADEITALRDALREKAAKRDEQSGRQAELDVELANATFRLKPAAALNSQLADITALAEREGILVDRVEPGASASTPLATKIPIRFAGRGPSPGAVRFLAALRHGFPDIAVEGFELTALVSPTSEAGEAAWATAAFRFDCVWYADRPADAPKTAVVEP